MPVGRRPGRGGRRGRRTAAMIRVANERITDLFGLAEYQAREGRLGLADRYVFLARRIGTRYNVRLLPEFRELYCRGCSSYWVEGQTVRTRLRAGRRVRRCLVCGRTRRVVIRPRPTRAGAPETSRTRVVAGEAALVDDHDAAGGDLDPDEEQEE